jgi:hypothetical protein
MYVLRGNGVNPSQADFLKVLKTLTYYNFQQISATALRQIVITTTTNANVITASVSNLALRITRNLNCTSAAKNVDLVFLLDSSSVSSSLYFWNKIEAFLAEVLKKIPVSSQNIRFETEYFLAIMFVCLKNTN